MWVLDLFRALCRALEGEFFWGKFVTLDTDTKRDASSFCLLSSLRPHLSIANDNTNTGDFEMNERREAELTT